MQTEEIKSKRISYSAVVLDKKSRSKLLQIIECPLGWEQVAHHLTINMGELKDKSLLGKKFTLKVVSIAKSDKVIAVGIETDAPSKWSVKHITVAVNRLAGGKPAMAGELTGWKNLSNPFILTGTVQKL